MPKLPILKSRQIITALEKAGFRKVRQKGSHIVLRRERPFAQVVVPDHRSIDTGTLAAILDGAGLTIEQLNSLL